MAAAAPPSAESRPGVGPHAMLVAALALASCALIWFASTQWWTLLGEYLPPTDSLELARRSCARAFLALGDPQVDRERQANARAHLRQARMHVRDLLEGRSSLAGLPALPSPDPQLRASIDAYANALGAFEAVIGGSGETGAEPGVTLRNRYELAEQAADRVRAALDHHLVAGIERQRLWQAGGLALWVLFLGVAAALLVVARRAEAAARHRMEAAQAARRASDLTRRSLLHSIDDGVVIASAARLLAANPALGRMLGAPDDAIVGRGFEALVGEEFLDLLRERVSECLAGRALEPFEVRLARSDGGEAWAEIRVSRIEYEGAPVVLGTMRDVSARRTRLRAILAPQAPVLPAEHQPDHDLRAELYAQVRDNPRIFDFLQAGSLDGLWYRDLERPDRMWMNARFWQVLGYDPAARAHTAQAWQDVLWPEDLAVAKENLERHLVDPEHPYDQVVRYRHADGSTVWIRCRGIALRDGAGRPQRMLGAHTDVTALALADELRLREALLQQGVARMRRLADRLPQLVWTCDAEGRCDFLGERWLQYTGRPEAEQLGNGWLAQVHPEDVAALTARWQACIAAGSEFRHHFRLRRHDGVHRWFDTRAVPLVDEHGRVQQWFGSNTDIQEQRELEERLKEGERRFRAIFEQAAVGIAEVALDGRWLQINQRLCDLLGYSREELMTLSFQDLSHPDDLKADLSLVAQVLDGSLPTYTLEKRYRRKDGTLLWAELTVGLMRDGDGRALNFVSVISDSGARRAAEQALLDFNRNLEQRVAERTAALDDANHRLTAQSEALDHANAELSRQLAELRRTQRELVNTEKLSSLGTMVAGVAHELNTPIGAAMIAAALVAEQVEHLQQAYDQGLRRSALESHLSAQRETAGELLANLQRAGRLVSQFKQVAADRATADRGRFTLAAVVSDVLALLHGTLRRSPHRVVTDLPTELELDSYPGPLGQVIQNLVQNALVHAFPDGRPGTVSVTARRVASEVELDVCDDGRGIDDTTAARVFDPFFTTRRGQGGTGLGLYVVHQLVSAILGGTIELGPGEDGRGTRFRLRLPVRAPTRPDA